MSPQEHPGIPEVVAVNQMAASIAAGEGGTMNIAPLVNKIDELNRENALLRDRVRSLDADLARARETIAGWAGVMAAHQPAADGVTVKATATYSTCKECERLRGLLQNICDASEESGFVKERASDCPCNLCKCIREARAALDGKEPT